MTASSTVLVTAGQLRAQGAVIDANIPDHAWVPAHSVHLKPVPGSNGVWSKVPAADGSGASVDKYVVTMQATFSVPFTWDDDATVRRGTTTL